MVQRMLRIFGIPCTTSSPWLIIMTFKKNIVIFICVETLIWQQWPRLTLNLMFSKIDQHTDTGTSLLKSGYDPGWHDKFWIKIEPTLLVSIRLPAWKWLDQPVRVPPVQAPRYPNPVVPQSHQRGAARPADNAITKRKLFSAKEIIDQACHSILWCWILICKFCPATWPSDIVSQRPGPWPRHQYRQLAMALADFAFSRSRLRGNAPDLPLEPHTHRCDPRSVDYSSLLWRRFQSGALNRVLGIQYLDQWRACTLFLLLRRLSSEKTMSMRLTHDLGCN